MEPWNHQILKNFKSLKNLYQRTVDNIMFSSAPKLESKLIKVRFA